MSQFGIVPGLIVILGATATGKTRIAIELAKLLGSPILSADSRQVYRRLDIGTAKPSITERQGIPHYLIDIAEPDTNLTLAIYQQQAQSLISQFHSQDITPILVGGTGLYIKSIVAGLKIPRVSPQTALRSQLALLGQRQCFAMLQQVDPNTSKQIHAHDRVRTIRALEVFYVTGSSLSELQGQNPPVYPIWQIGIETPASQVHQQWISDRIEQMLNAGWLDEIRQLQRDYGEDLPLLRTLGYAEMCDYLSGQIDLDIAKKQTIIHTCQFVKRQKTWFTGTASKDNRMINWVSSDIASNNLLDLIHDGKDR